MGIGDGGGGRRGQIRERVFGRISRSFGADSRWGWFLDGRGGCVWRGSTWRGGLGDGGEKREVEQAVALLLGAKQDFVDDGVVQVDLVLG